MTLYSSQPEELYTDIDASGIDASKYHIQVCDEEEFEPEMVPEGGSFPVESVSLKTYTVSFESREDDVIDEEAVFEALNAAETFEDFLDARTHIRESGFDPNTVVEFGDRYIIADSNAFGYRVYRDDDEIHHVVVREGAVTVSEEEPTHDIE